MQNEDVGKILCNGLYENAFLNGNPLYYLLEWGRPTNSILSRVLLTIEQKSWCQIKALKHVFLKLSDM